MSKGAIPWDIAAFTRGDWEGAGAVAHRVEVGARLRRRAAQWLAMSPVALADVTPASFAFCIGCESAALRPARGRPGFDGVVATLGKVFYVCTVVGVLCSSS